MPGCTNTKGEMDRACRGTDEEEKVGKFSDLSRPGRVHTPIQYAIDGIHSVSLERKVGSMELIWGH